MYASLCDDTHHRVGFESHNSSMKKRKLLYLQPETIDLIVEESKTKSQYKISDKLGISRSSVFRIVHSPDKYKAMFNKQKKEREEEKLVNSMYVDYTTAEIHNITGITKKRIWFIAGKFRLRHSEETMRRAVDDSMEEKRSKEFREQMSRTMRLLWKMETMRVMSGEKQKSKFYIPEVSRKISRRISEFCTRHGYFRLCREYGCRVAFYDNKTRRKPLLEQKMKEKYGVTFMPSDDYIDDNKTEI